MNEARQGARWLARAGPWWPAVLVAVALHAAWAAVLAPSPAAPRGGPPAAPSVAYMPMRVDGPGGAPAEADVRTLWSPALFSLPTHVGFSGSMLTNELRTYPPVGMRPVQPLYLERAPSSSPVVFPAPALGAAVASAPGHLAARRLDAPAFPPRAATGTPATRVELSGELVGRRFEDPALPAELRGEGDKPWDITVYVETDADGRVARVLIEGSTAPEAAAGKVARVLRTWRLEQVDGPARGRVTLRYPGRAAAVLMPAPAAEDGP